MKELFRIPEKIRKLLDCRIPDYDFYLIEADYVNAEDYKTDLREFFQAMQCRKDKKKLDELCHSEKFRNLDSDTIRMIAVHIDREKLIPKIEKEGIEMCQALEELLEDKRVEGKEEGKKEGERLERISIIRQMMKAGLEEALIFQITRCSKEEMLAAAGQ